MHVILATPLYIIYTLAVITFIYVDIVTSIVMLVKLKQLVLFYNPAADADTPSNLMVHQNGRLQYRNKLDSYSLSS